MSLSIFLLTATYSLAFGVWKTSVLNQNKTREANFQLTMLMKRSWKAWKFSLQTQGSFKKMRKAVVSFMADFRARLFSLRFRFQVEIAVI